MSPLHAVGAFALFLALCGTAGVIGMKISSGPNLTAAENSTGLKAERELDVQSQLFAKDNRAADLKKMPPHQPEGTKEAIELIVVETTPSSFVDESPVKEAKPIPTKTVGESLMTATEETKAAAEKQPASKRVAKAKRVEVKKAKTKAIASAAVVPRLKPKSLAKKPKFTRGKKGRNTDDAAARKVAVKEVASPVSEVTEQRASKAIERPAAAEQEHRSSNNSSDECRPRAFRSYIAGRMRPCDYW